MSEFLLLLLWPILPLSVVVSVLSTGLAMLMWPEYFGIQLPWKKEK